MLDCFESHIIYRLSEKTRRLISKKYFIYLLDTKPIKDPQNIINLYPIFYDKHGQLIYIQKMSNDLNDKYCFIYKNADFTQTIFEYEVEYKYGEIFWESIWHPFYVLYVAHYYKLLKCFTVPKQYLYKTDKLISGNFYYCPKFRLINKYNYKYVTIWSKIDLYLHINYNYIEDDDETNEFMEFIKSITENFTNFNNLK